MSKVDGEQKSFNQMFHSKRFRDEEEFEHSSECALLWWVSDEVNTCFSFSSHRSLCDPCDSATQLQTMLETEPKWSRSGLSSRVQRKERQRDRCKGTDWDKDRERDDVPNWDRYRDTKVVTRDEY